jgi:tryptophan synthase alpha chain
MNRLSQCLAKLADRNQKALVTYIVNGDPTPEITLQAMHTLVKAGADVIELGVPFSDPMAEGPVIQKGHERALVHNTSLKGSLALVAEFRKTDSSTPVVLMGYANPVERMGYQTFTDAAVRSGVDGLLTVDLPPEECMNLHGLLRDKGLECIFLLAPTSTGERIKKVTELAGGFIYYVSLKGVTGAGHLDVGSIQEKVGQIRQNTQLPVMVGFGIKDAASAKAVAQLADGVVLGSSLVEIMGDPALTSAQVLAKLSEKVASIRAAIDEIAR